MDGRNWMNLGSDRGGSKYDQMNLGIAPRERRYGLRRTGPWKREAARKRDIRDNWRI